MDAAAVAAASGLAHPKVGFSRGLGMAAVFGVFQAAMPCIGWLAGRRLAGVAEHYTPWIAFVILLALGIKTIHAALSAKDEDATARPNPFALRVVIGLGIATSLDALAVGVTLPLLAIPLWICATVIGGVTFGLAASAFQFGRSIGDRLGKRLEVLGGVALIAVGAELLLSHLL
ncbi:manganese efflux pump MntP family protein [soil metagenome]